MERGDDRRVNGVITNTEIYAPSTVTRFGFHTGAPDGIDNDNDRLTDEFDPIAGYEEEAMKGKFL